MTERPNQSMKPTAPFRNKFSVFVPASGRSVPSLGIMRQSRRDQRVLRSLSPDDRQFIADQFEPFTRLPLSTAEDEDAWDEARHATFQRLGERVPDFAREVLPRFLPYFNDADIFRREPDYRAVRERYVLKFINELRGHTQA